MFESQLEWIRSLHHFRSPFIDECFKFLNYFDRVEFWLVFIPTVWVVSGWKNGLRFFYITLVSSLLNYQLKNLFLLPRPFQVDPSVGVIQVSGHGFPSGGAQSAVLLAGLLIYYSQSRWKWGIGLSYALLISFSRIYLGVHYPVDVLGGWICGGFLLWLFIDMRPRLETFLRQQSRFSLFVLSLAIPLMFILLLPPGRLPFQLCANAIGISCGVFFLGKHLVVKVPAKKWEQVSLSLLLVAAIFGLHFVMAFFLPEKLSSGYLFIQFFLLGLCLPLLGCFLVKRSRA